jgi:uncharacterized SAM-binding protein YcdF (DUF218 family)
MDAIVVLAHLMSRTGSLDMESRARADSASELASTLESTIIITPGWPYRNDTLIPIGEAMQRYIRSDSRISNQRIISEARSRDTVGDAVFSKDVILELGGVGSVFVVTSDYHSPRAEEIFNFVYGERVEIIMHPVQWDATDQMKAKEVISLAAFRETFKDLKPGDTIPILDRLFARHPLYSDS